MKDILDAVEYCQNLGVKVKLTFEEIPIPEFASICTQKNIKPVSYKDTHLFVVWNVDSKVDVILWTEKIKNDD